MGPGSRPPGLLWHRPLARLRPTSGRTTRACRPPARSRPPRAPASPTAPRPTSGSWCPTGPPARLSASRPASARPVGFRPHTRQTPDASSAPSPVAPPPTSDHPGRSPCVPRHPRAPGRRTPPTVRSRAPGSPVATRRPAIYPADPRNPRCPPWPTSGSATPPSPGPAQAVARTRPFDAAAAPPATGGAFCPNDRPVDRRTPRHPRSPWHTARQAEHHPTSARAPRPLAPLQITSGTEGMVSVVATFHVSKLFLVTSGCTLCKTPHALQVQLGHDAHFASSPFRRHNARVSPRARYTCFAM